MRNLFGLCWLFNVLWGYMIFCLVLAYVGRKKNTAFYSGA